MSRSDDLMKMLRSGGESAINQLINDRGAESLFLEFKRATTSASSKGLESQDRENLAKAISGFGNSSGGVLVWGVVCGDTPTEKLPIDDAERFRSLVENAISGCTLPPHTEVENHVIPSSQSNRGFVVTHIPKSNSAPHQALPRHLYYIRAGSNFVPATHDTIAGLFGRRPQPSIAVNFFAESANRIREASAIRLVFSINLLNLGAAPVGDVFLNSEVWGPTGATRITGAPLVSDENWTIEAPVGACGHSFVSRDPYRLAPRVPVPIIRIEMSLKEPFESDFTMKLIYGAGGAPITIREKTISGADLKQLFDRFYHAGEIDQKEFFRSLLPEISR